jgi:hypothetical protein
LDQKSPLINNTVDTNNNFYLNYLINQQYLKGISSNYVTEYMTMVQMLQYQQLINTPFPVLSNQFYCFNNINNFIPDDSFSNDLFLKNLFKKID